MVPALRKRHVALWSVLLPVLMLGLGLAYAWAPKSDREALYRPVQAHPLRETLAFAEDALLKVNVRTSSDSLPAYQAEFVLKMPLMQPSTAVYLANTADESGLENMTALGVLGPQGVYRMALPAPDRAVWQFVFYDFVKQKIWHRIEVKK
jgi:hypothetical protein